MTRARTRCLAAATLLLGATAGAHTQPFANVKYLDGLRVSAGRAAHSLVNGGELPICGPEGPPRVHPAARAGRGVGGAGEVHERRVHRQETSPLLPLLLPLAASAGEETPGSAAGGRRARSCRSDRRGPRRCRPPAAPPSAAGAGGGGRDQRGERGEATRGRRARPHTGLETLRPRVAAQAERLDAVRRAGGLRRSKRPSFSV